MKFPVVFIAFLLLAVLASMGNAYFLRSLGPVPEVAEAGVAVVVAAIGGGGAAVPGPLPAVGAVGGGAAVAGAVPAANVAVVPVAVVPAVAAVPVGAGGGVPAGGAGVPDGNLPVPGRWFGWATGVVTGVRTFVAAHPVAVGGAVVVTMAAGITAYNYSPDALDHALEGSVCYWETMNDYQEVLQVTYGECTSLTHSLEWRKRMEALKACGTGTRPHKEQANQARTDRFAREMMEDMQREQREADARKAREKKEGEEREELERQAQAAREEAERVEVHSGHGQHDDNVTNDSVRDTIPTNQEDEYPSWMTFNEEGNKIDSDEATETESGDDEQLEGEDDWISNAFEEAQEGQEQQSGGMPQAHSEGLKETGQEGKQHSEVELGGNAGGNYLGALKEAVGNHGMMTTFSLFVPAPVLLFAGALWGTDTGKMLATLAIYKSMSTWSTSMCRWSRRCTLICPWMSF